MTKKKSSVLDEKIEELAIAVADDALAADTPLLRQDALKILTAFRVGSHKANKDQDTEEEKTGTMGAMKRRIQEADGPSNVVTIPTKKD